MADTDHTRVKTRQRDDLIGRTALVLFLMLAALIGAIVLTLDRQASHTNLNQAVTQLTSSADVAASSLRTLRADVRARASRLAISSALQQAVATRDTELVRRIARSHNARIDVFGRRLGTLPPQPRFTSTVIIASEGAAIAHVTVGLGLDAVTLERVRKETVLPAHATLLIIRRGSVIAGGPRGEIARVNGSRLDLGATRFVAGSAGLSIPDTRVVAIEPFAAVSARTSHYVHRVLIAALLTLLITTGLAVRLARPLARVVDDLSDRADHDPLTGLANRRLIDDRLREELDRSRRHGTHLALVLVDIDDFKQVNDRYGHLSGDEVLRRVADVLAQSLRELDLAGRFGGEEFALVLPGTSADAASGVAEKIRRAFSSIEVLGPAGEHIGVSASFGVADYPTALDVHVLIECADANLYEAKRRGKNQVVGQSAEGEEWAYAAPRAPA